MPFVHHDLRLINPSFSSPLVDVLTDLEYLRRAQLQGTTPYPVFLQLKQLFHVLESLASARIEGNHTTLADYVETKISTETAGPAHVFSDSFREIENIERAMQQVETELERASNVTEALIRGLHATTVVGLEREGDRTPGAYRTDRVAIGQADHEPPEFVQVPGYMTKLVEFINRGDAPKYDLIKVALAHHRFAWIHPFFNGNGRVVRLLTYAMLIKYGFRVDRYGRLLNPAAVFCADRNRYYAMLARADEGTDEALEEWCNYVLVGVRDELRKVDRLTDYTFLKGRILHPALAYARERELVTQQEHAVLTLAVEKSVAKAGDLEPAMPGLNLAQRTYQVKKLLQSKMLVPTKEKGRQYSIGFFHATLLRGVIDALTTEGFIPTAMAAPAWTPALAPVPPANPA
jgi:Fic family protein